MNSGENPEQEQDSPEEQSTLVTKLERRWEQLRDRMQHYRAWFVDQPRKNLAITMLIGFALVNTAFVVLRLVAALLAGINDWLFVEDTPPPPEPAGPLEIAVEQLLTYVADSALRWSVAHSVGGVDPVQMLVLWLLIGAGLLLFLRTWPGAVLLGGWSVATVWAFYTATPGGNPVPAALLAGTIALAWCGWWLISAPFARLFR